MHGALKKHDLLIRSGTVISGKWHGGNYSIRRKLGEGAVGTVYLCEKSGREYALKMSDDGSSMTTEVNVLKSLDKVQVQQLGPCLLDVDDWQSPDGTNYSFYVMEYIQGQSLDQYLRKNGSEWVGVFLLQLLGNLGQLHKEGWVFGDLKLDNLLVSPSPARLRWVDVGGVTKIGRSIKEYTEFTDRGYWGLGSRKAEPSYDLFAVVMLFLNLFHPRRFGRSANNERLICMKIDEVKVFTPYSHCFKKAIRGKYGSSEEMRREVAEAMRKRRSGKKQKLVQNSKRPRTRRVNRQVEPVRLVEGGSIIAAAALFYVISLLL
ncbi:protein kinase [Aciduricibacillus chroicocephali]|uniref:Protein kinase n=1 Tax=Aciduricibacillus chroicocephali TaxID=3054939 RepID=A0ABY9KVF8_9BACI|nr:protein kinase [Bacillaceae bacterium 44XB]